MKKITITDTFSMADWLQMDKFITENFHPKYIMRNRSLFEWQFCGHGNAEDATLICAYAEDQLIGILGYMPSETFWGNVQTPIRATWMTNWIVDSSYRSGAGVLMLRRLMELYPVLLGQGLGNMNIPIAKALKFKIYAQIPRYISVFDVKKTQAFATSPDLHVSEVATELKEIAGLGRELPVDYDPDWSLYPGLSFSTVRSASYLRWKYVNHPVFKYDVVVMGSAREPAVCVFRIEQSKGLVKDYIGRIAEFYHPHSERGERDGVLVLKAALAEMSMRGCAFADFYCATDIYLESIVNAGMELATDTPIANRMSPVELVHHNQNLEVWANSNLPTPPELNDFYITKADGDQDRPN